MGGLGEWVNMIKTHYMKILIKLKKNKLAVTISAGKKFRESGNLDTWY